MKRAAVGGVLAGALLLAGCEDVNNAVNQANGTANKVAACTEAIGIMTSFNPAALDSQQLQAQAEQKANRMRELGNQVAEQPVRDSLFAAADTYVDLERKQADGMANATDWVRRNTENLDRLRQVCGA